jgi:omega-3 fatty acid desaturase (delta-15 desaturase)
MTSNYFLIGWLAVLGACTVKLGLPAMFNLYFMPYWFFVVWLDVVTYLQHHGSHDPEEKLPWFRGEVSGRGKSKLPVFCCNSIACCLPGSSE